MLVEALQARRAGSTVDHSAGVVFTYLQKHTVQMMHNNEAINNRDIKEHFSENGELPQSLSTGADKYFVPMCVQTAKV